MTLKNPSEIEHGNNIAYKRFIENTDPDHNVLNRSQSAKPPQEDLKIMLRVLQKRLFYRPVRR